MADKKFFPSFGYNRRHEIDPRLRRDLCAEFGIDFTEEDFTEMAHAVDAALGAYEALRSAPSPKDLLRQFERVRDAAHGLRTLLCPQLIESHADLRRPPVERTPDDYHAAKEAADRIMHELRLGASLPIEMSEASEKSRIDDVETFIRVLNQIPMFCDMLTHSLQEADRDGLPWVIMSERGTGHLVYLLRDLTPIAERHGKPTRYTRSTYGSSGSTSFIAELALRLGQMLPKGARPASEGQLIALLARQPVPKPTG